MASRLCQLRPGPHGKPASEQLQLDVYGEVADAISTMRRAKLHLDPRIVSIQQKLTNYVAKICYQPSSGIWEQRGRQDQFTYSKVMAWLALNHGVEAAKLAVLEGPAGRWVGIRDRLHREICQHGFNKSIGSFVQSYGSQTLDASSLLIPIFGFLPFDDERVRGTIRAIEQHLTRDGVVYRFKARSKEKRGPRSYRVPFGTFRILPWRAACPRPKSAMRNCFSSE